MNQTLDQDQGSKSALIIDHQSNFLDLQNLQAKFLYWNFDKSFLFYVNERVCSSSSIFVEHMNQP